MTTKEYLSQIRTFDKRIKRKTDEIDRLRNVAISIGMDMTKERVQTSGTKDRVGNSVSAIVDAQNDALKCVADYVELRSRIVDQISSMDKMIHSDILYLRYVEGKKYKLIADELSYSEDYVIHTHTEALAAFAEKYGKDYL